MSLYAQDFFVIRKSGKYFGHVNYQTNPVVFAFRKHAHVEKVRQSVSKHNYKIDDHNASFYKVVYEPKMKVRPQQFEVVSMGYFDLNLHISMNNVNLYVIDNIIEDDEANMYFVNCKTRLEPIFINDAMMRMHLNKIVTLNTNTVRQVDE